MSRKSWICKAAALALALGMTVTAGAQTGTPNTEWYGAGKTEFTISTADELAGLAAIVNGTWGGTPERDDFSGKTVTLVKNIDLSGYENWVPIGGRVIDSTGILQMTLAMFSGTFNGGRHIISNLTINRPDAGYQGLFGYISSGSKVENLGLDNVNILGEHAVGSIVGRIIGGRVTNC